jgi:hypothetical protein
MKFPPYADLHKISEDDRIALIGSAAMSKVVGVMVDAEPADKAPRYVKKVLERFPGVQHIDTGPGPTAGIVLVRFGPRLEKGELH